jgi:hypothetical protein
MMMMMMTTRRMTMVMEQRKGRLGRMQQHGKMITVMRKSLNRIVSRMKKMMK